MNDGLQIEDLSVRFPLGQGQRTASVLSALDRVSLSIAPGEQLAIVGESGSGKSVLALAIAGLLPRNAQLEARKLRYGNRELATEPAARERIAMVFQHPRRALNPLRKVGQQLIDVLRTLPQSRRLSRGALRERAVALLDDVGIDHPAARFAAYPFELSGGLCQRVMIALALARQSSLLIADEPTTGLDVISQRTVLDLIGELAQRHRMATLLITHDLAIAANRSERIAVMHAGQLVETAPSRVLLNAPAHPYTRGLLAASPHHAASIEMLREVPGEVPNLSLANAPACRFFGRCASREDRCARETPALVERAGAQRVACWSAI
ncbi:ABC transporter ATP-binding protein [Paraburkholderia xenovorans]|uniref:ABC transporter ATP-binding protein n=1 Tax=Paraburkholderia xenovorans TaxID=36873 RepID=UPI0038B7EF48